MLATPAGYPCTRVRHANSLVAKTESTPACTKTHHYQRPQTGGSLKACVLVLGPAGRVERYKGTAGVLRASESDLPCPSLASEIQLYPTGGTGTFGRCGPPIFQVSICNSLSRIHQLKLSAVTSAEQSMGMGRTSEEEAGGVPLSRVTEACDQANQVCLRARTRWWNVGSWPVEGRCVPCRVLVTALRNKVK